MKTKIKHISRRALSLILCFIMMFSTLMVGMVSAANAATISSDGSARLYFNMSAVNWWSAGTNGDGNFAYFFNSNNSKEGWSAHSVQYDNNGIYYVVIPSGEWTTVILTRNNTSTTPSWDNKWNQTDNITLSDTSNYISSFSENSTSATWGTAIKPTSNASLTASSTSIKTGDTSTLSTALLTNADINTIKSTSYSVSPSSGASISDNTFTATKAGTYTVTATVTYHPNGYSSITSTATATTTITVTDPYYDVVVSSGEGGNVTSGSTTISAGTSNTVSVGSTAVSFTATANDGYEFTGWTLGDGLSLNSGSLTDTYIAVTATQASTLTATFTKSGKFSISSSATGSGTVSVVDADGNDITNSSDVEENTKYTVTATPDSGYALTSLTVNGTEVSSGYSAEITENTKVVATFTEIMHTVTVDAGDYGTASNTSLSAGIDTSDSFTVTLNDNNYNISNVTASDGVTVTYDSATASYKVNATADGTVTVSYEKDTANINYATVGDGIVLTAYTVVDNGDGTTTDIEIANASAVEAGTVVKVVATVTNGAYEVASWTAETTDGVVSDDNLSYTFTVSKADKDENGGISVICSSQMTFIPDFAEKYWNEYGYVYFHTLGNDITNDKAWTVVEGQASQNSLTIPNYSGYDTYQVFLPENAKNSDDTYTVFNYYGYPVKFSNDTTSVTIENNKIGYVPSDVNKFSMNGGDSVTFNIYTSSAEDTVYITTNSKSEYSGATADEYDVNNLSSLVKALALDDGDYDHKDKAEVKKADFTVIGDDGTVYVSEKSKKIKGRGNTTWKYTNKKSWNVNLDNNVSIDGMGENKKWSLLANFQDPSMARNRFILDLADSVGLDYAPDSRFVELYVNGLYVGSYQLTHKHDNIQGLNDAMDVTEDPETEEVTAVTLHDDFEFMIELACSSQGDEVEFTPGNGSGILNLTLPDPGDVSDYESVAPGLTESITTYIKDKYDTFYDLLTDPTTTYEELSAVADLDSLAKVYLIQELSKNYDSGVSSFYISYELCDDGVYRFKGGTVWDFDNSLGNPNATDAGSRNTANWWCEYWYGNSQGYTGNLVNAMSKNTYIMQAARKAWFGTSADDATSFVYNLNQFENGNKADISSADSGLQSRSYYKNVLSSMSTCNTVKWPIVPNDWCGSHTTLNSYDITDFSITDYTNYTLSGSLTNGTTGYTDATFNGEYDYAADYMLYRADWLSWQLGDTGEYYLQSDTAGWTKSANDYKFTATDTAGVYVLKDVLASDVTGSSYFKLSDGTNYIGPVNEADASLTYDADTDTYVTNLAFYNTDGEFTTGTLNDACENWYTVDIYYQPSTNKIWLDGTDAYDVNVSYNSTYASVDVVNAKGTPQSENYLSGDTYTVNVTPADGFSVSKITIDGTEAVVTSADGVYSATGTMGDANQEVVVYLSEESYSVMLIYDDTLGTITNNLDGSVVSSYSSVEFGAVMGIDLLIKPNKFYTYTITSSNSSITYTESTTTEDLYNFVASAKGTIVVEFAKYNVPVVYDITGDCGTIAVTYEDGTAIQSGTSIETGTEITVTVTLEDGCEAYNWNIPSSAVKTDGAEQYTYAVDGDDADAEGNIVISVDTKVANEPSWAENYVYFSTVADNVDNEEAWTVMERDSSTKDDTISVGTYANNVNYRVFVPANAINSDDTYTVFNNYTTDIEFSNADGDTFNVTANGGYARIPADTCYIQFSGASNKYDMYIYQSTVEDSVYISTNESSEYSGATADEYAVDSLSTLIKALALDGVYTHKDYAEVKKATFTVIGDDGTVYVSEQSKKIKGRGNSTWSGTKKKSWNVNLDSKVSIDGMGENKKYSLLANFQDPSLSRNRFLLDLADSVGIPYSSDSRYTDVYVNGLYVGSYLLTQKYDNIENVQDAEDIFNDDYTLKDEFEFMIELACDQMGDDLEIYFGEGNTYTTADGILSVALPDAGDIADLEEKYGVEVTAQIADYIRAKYLALYEALTDPDTTYDELSALIDVESLAKVYLINELGKNWDAGVSSFYLTYEDGKFVASPVWDFDNSLGNCKGSLDTLEEPYSSTAGWWCKYWYGNDQQYTGNFLNAAANSEVIKLAAKKAWFGTGVTDETSFVYHINNFQKGKVNHANISSADSGLQPSVYYKSVISSSATNNFLKWSIAPNNNWVADHTSLDFYEIDIDLLYTDMNMENYTLPYWYAEDQAYTTHYYDNTAIISTSKNGGRYDFASDYLISRAAWISYHLCAPNAYYLAGDNYGWVTTPTDVMLTESVAGSGIYSARGVALADLYGKTTNGNNTYFKLNNGEKFIGPSTETSGDVALTLATDTNEMYAGRNTYYTYDTTVQTNNVGAYYINVNDYTITDEYLSLYYQPSTGKLWITPYVADEFTAPTVSLVSDDDDDKIEIGDSVTLTATASDITAKLDGATEFSAYTGPLVYEFYLMTGGSINSSVDTLVGTTTTVKTTASITFEPEATATYYVKVYPENAESNATIASLIIYYGREAKTVEIDLYIDFNGATVSSNPTLTTTNDDDDEKTYTLTKLVDSKLGDSNIYTSKVIVDYYKSVTGLLTNNFNLDTITVDGAVVGFTNSAQPDINSLVNYKTLWLKSKDNTLEPNVTDGSYEIDTTLTYEVDANAQHTYTTINNADRETKRVYFSNNMNWDRDNIYIHYWGGSESSSWPGIAMTWFADNEYSQGLYFADIPADTTKVIFNNNAGTQSAEVTLSRDFSVTGNNAYYMESSDNDNVVLYNISSPAITTYTSTLNIDLGATTLIVPEGNFEKVEYTVADTSVVTVDSDGNLTPVASGSTTVTLQPRVYYGENYDFGSTVTVTVNVCNKSTLGNLIANAQVIAAQEEENDTYTLKTYTVFETAYAAAVEAYTSVFAQAEIDVTATALENAINRLKTSPSTEEFDLISYKTAVVSVVTNCDDGSVSQPEFGYVQEIDGGYSVTYAANDGTAEFAYNLSSAASTLSEEAFYFSGWTMGNGIYTTDHTLSVTTAPDASCVFTANFISTGSRILTLTYNFQDYDTSDKDYVYSPSKKTVDASYSTFTVLDEEYLNTSNALYSEDYLKAIITDTDDNPNENFVPTIKSNYFDYSIDMNNLGFTVVSTDEDGYITEISIDLANTAHVYHVTVGGIDVNCYYQELLYLDAEMFGYSSTDEVYWYIENADGTESVLSTSNIYEMYVVMDVDIKVKGNDDGVTLDGKSEVTNTYYELSYNSSGTQKITQNFYIIDYYTGVAYDNDGNVIVGATNVNFIGGGVTYVSMTPDGNDDYTYSNSSAAEYMDQGVDGIKLFLSERISDYNVSINAKTDGVTKIGYRYLTKADGGSVYRYSDSLEAYQYIFAMTFTNSSANADKQVRLYSYYVYTYDLDGKTYTQISVSDTYATASMYEASTSA